MNQENSLKKEDLLLKPSQVLIDNWKLWITKEVVVQLKTKNNVKSQLSNLSTVIDFDKLANFENIFVQFKNKVSKSQQNCKSIRDLEEAKIRLDKTYNDLIPKNLKSTSLKLQTESRNRLQEYLSEDLEKASPENLINYLQEVAKLFLAQRSKFNYIKFNLIEQKKSANQAYNNLLQINNYQSESESIWKALILIYQLQFIIEQNQLLNEIILNLIQLIQNYYNSSNQTLVLLENIEMSLTKKCSFVLSSIPIFTYLNFLDIDEQQNLIDKWLGHKINYWGDSDISSQQLQAKIMDNIESLTRKIFFDFQVEFLENTIITIQK